MSSILQGLKLRQRRFDRSMAERRLDDPSILNAGSWAKVLPSGKAILAVKGNGPARVDEGQMSATLTISTSGPDRHDDIVISEGCKPYLASYEKNAQVYFNHRSWDFPIGLASKDGVLALDIQPTRIDSTCYFHQATLEAVQVFELVKLGVLRAASIGFIPKRGKRLKPPDVDENAPRDQVDFGSWMSYQFDLWELVEWSIVGIPANPDAVGMALGKGLAGKAVCAPLRRALEPFAPLRRGWDTGYKGGIKVAKSWDAIKKLLAKAEDDASNGGNPQGASGEGEGGGEAKNSIQALLCPKATYPTSDDAVEYVDSLGLDSSDVEDAGDFWAFIQFEAETCTPDSAKREEMEDGCQVVLCVRAESDEGKPSRVADTTGGDTQGDSTGDTKSKGGCKGTCACKGGAKTKMETPTEQKPEKILPGKALIKAFKVILDELGPMQENTSVKKGCKKTASLWGKISKKEYPDEDFGFKAEDDEPDEDEGEGGEGDGKPKEGEDGDGEGKKNLSRKALVTCKDLASWLAELAGEKNLTSSQKAAAKHHASQIADLLSGKTKGGEGEEAIDLSVAEKVFAKIKEQGERLSQQVYKLTGK